jgi:hypothetical protein
MGKNCTILYIVKNKQLTVLRSLVFKAFMAPLRNNTVANFSHCKPFTPYSRNSEVLQPKFQTNQSRHRDKEWRPQSIQSARLSFQSSEMGPPTPHPQDRVAPHPFGSKEGDILAGGPLLRPASAGVYLGLEPLRDAH